MHATFIFELTHIQGMNTLGHTQAYAENKLINYYLQHSAVGKHLAPLHATTLRVGIKTKQITKWLSCSRPVLRSA